MERRGFLAALGAGTLAALAYRFWPDEGFINPCLDGPLPSELAEHPLVRSAWDGIDFERFWDAHVHLVGVGDGGHGVWFNPAMDSLWSPVQYLRKQFYLNASCADGKANIDARYVQRLAALHGDLPAGARLMLLAFDYYCDERGQPVPELSTYYAPNNYARDVAQRHPDSFEWIASIHPYRPDAVEQLEWAAAHGARAVKWLPPAMGMDPASARCDRFYDALVKWKLPLLLHTGEELAVHAKENQALGNPLRLRRPLDRGVRVLAAHCASLGSDVDLDRGEHASPRPSFDLFARLMGEPRYEGLLFGEISAMTQVNRLGRPLREILTRTEWHDRLINGSDYPLPAVMPIFSLKRLVTLGYLKPDETRILSNVRRYNPLLFDFLLKRLLAFNGSRLPARVFHSRRLFERFGSPAA